MLRAKKKRKRKKKFWILFAPTQSGIKASIPKQCQPMAGLPNAGQLWQHTYGKCNTFAQEPDTDAPEDAWASSEVFDETLKAAANMISVALTNKERMLDCMERIAFGCTALPGLRAYVFWGPSTAPSLHCYCPTCVCGRCAPYLGVRGIEKSNKSHGNELNESANWSGVCALSYAKTVCSTKAVLLMWEYLSI